MNDSERTKKWAKDNPYRNAANVARAKIRKDAMKAEAKKAYKKTPHKTAHKAIKAFCNSCPNGTSRSGFDYAPVECVKRNCPLFAYRNFNASLLGRNKDIIMSHVRDCRKG